MKIGQEIFGISIQQATWDSKVRFQGKVVSFDDDTIVMFGDDIWGLHTHGEEADVDWVISFLDRKTAKLFDSAEERDKAMKARKAK